MSSANEYLAEVPEVTAAGGVIQPLPPIVDAAQFVRLEVIRPPELIAGLLHQGSKIVVGGSSKAKKTWTLLGMGVSVATGVDWLGRATSQGNVLYVNLEIQAWAFQDRLQKILANANLRLKPDQLQIWNLRGFAADAVDLVPRMIKEIKARELSLVIVDPIYKCLGGRDENKAGDIAAMMNQLERLAVDTGAAVAFGAHYSKGNQAAKESIDRIGGSGVFARDPDTILTMTAHEEPDAFTVDATLRNFAPIKPFCVRWDYPLLKLAPDLLPENLRQPGARSTKIKPEPLEVLALLPTRWSKANPRAALLSGAELSALFDEHNFDRNTLVACRDRLEADGDIRVVRNLPRNMILAGLPGAVAAFERERAAGKTR